MLEKLKELNPDIEIYSVRNEVFRKYGRVLTIDTSEIVTACNQLNMPENGCVYEASVNELERLKCSDKLRELSLGGCEAQIGICHGYNSYMNGFEFHKSSEINVAATPLILILGLLYEMEDNEYLSKNAKAFYLEKGDAVEIYGTSLHFCPCQVSDRGFSSAVILPKGTNTVLDKPSGDELLFKKNKWIICHDENTGLIEKGVYPGIHGVNYQIIY